MSKIVLALGGNALGNTPKEQEKLIKDTSSAIVDLIVNNHEVVIVHGNGPQVGMIKNPFDSEFKSGKGPLLPLYTAGAMSQGYIGLDLQKGIKNELNKRKIKRDVSCLITQTEVSEKDKAFKNPTKPIGSFYEENEAKKLAKENGWIVKEDAGRGWRQVVPSPLPISIIEIESIKTLLNSNIIPICTGGGGIPTIIKKGNLTSVDAVIDKDNAASLLATELNADKLVILTAVDRVSVNYNKPDQKELEKMTIKECDKHIKDGQFAPGSMLPKIEAAKRFVVNNPGKQALIASLEKAKDALEGKSGTIIE